MDRSGLDVALIAAHAEGDARALVQLYTSAADCVEPEAAAFYLTQAYVFALASDDRAAGALHARLATMGREE